MTQATATETGRYTRAIVEYAVDFDFDRLTGEAVDQARALVLDTLGAMLLGSSPAYTSSWLTGELARLMGASRSSFAEAFTRTVGETPAKYVAKAKMFQARRWIARDGMRVAVAANRLRYDSEASFSRAFKRVIGHSPSAARGEMVQVG